MRLIDADKLMQDLADEMLAKALDMLNYDNVEYMINRLASTPTAFDVDKVVEQLEEQISKHDLLFNKYVKDKDKSNSWSISELNKIRGLLEAIDIVKAGEV